MSSDLNFLRRPSASRGAEELGSLRKTLPNEDAIVELLRPRWLRPTDP